MKEQTEIPWHWVSVVSQALVHDYGTGKRFLLDVIGHVIDHVIDRVWEGTMTATSLVHVKKAGAQHVPCHVSDSTVQRSYVCDRVSLSMYLESGTLRGTSLYSEQVRWNVSSLVLVTSSLFVRRWLR